MIERFQIEQAIQHLENQRAVLGNAVVDMMLRSLLDQLATLPGPSFHPEASLRNAAWTSASVPGERKLVTIMFADISGFTSLFEKMDPEWVRDLMNGCFNRLVPCIQRYDGTIDKFIGDEVMALFGAPLAHENDPERALRAALEMQLELARFNEEHHTHLDLHFGINTGLVLAGGIGSSGLQSYSVMGDAVNLASRLEDASERGQILVGPDTYRLAAPLFEFEPIAPITVKGKTEPIAIYRLTGVRAQPDSTRGLERKGLSSPLVGRNQELELALQVAQLACKGQGSILLVTGEAGLGKSRLMAELRRAAPELYWIEGKSFSFGQTISYFPFQEIIRTYAGIKEDDEEIEVWRKLESKIQDLFPDNALEILPYLATLLAIRIQGEYLERVRYLDGEALGKRILMAVRRLVESLACTGPLAVVFEDAQWMDESSLGLVEHLLHLVLEVPLLVVSVSRPETESPGMRLRDICTQYYPDCATEIRLNPLSQSESTQLVNNLLDIDNLPEAVHLTIVQKAEGNPFFLEEILRSLLEMGLLLRDPSSGRWRAVAQIESIRIPDTVQGVIMARIDRLDENVKQALRTAAVIGRSFLYRILREVDATDQALDEHIAHLQQIELVRQKKSAPELEYIFKHALAQEATYESILLQKRRELHGRAAQAIETLFASRLDEFASLLAYHYSKAENWAKAQEYLFKSGDQAGRMAADAEALTHYQQAMAAYEKAFGKQWDSIKRGQLECKVGEALYRQGEHQKAAAYLQHAMALAGSPLPPTLWAMRAAIGREAIRQVSHRLFPARLARGHDNSPDPAVVLECETYDTFGAMTVLNNPECFLYISLRYLNIAEKAGFGRGIVNGLSSVAVILDLILAYGLAENYYRKGLALAQELNDPLSKRYIHSGYGAHKMFTGELQEAIIWNERALRTTLEIGDLHWWGMAMLWTAQAYYHCNQLETALQRALNLAQAGEEVADRQMRCWGLAMQGMVLQRLGRLDEALNASQQAAAIAEVLPDTAFCISAHAEMGRCLLRQDRLEEARAALDRSETFYTPYLGGDSYVALYNGKVELYLRLAEQDNAQKASWLLKAEQASRRALRLEKEYRPGFTEALRLRGEVLWRLNRRGAAIKHWQRSLSEAAAMGQPYEAALVAESI